MGFSIGGHFGHIGTRSAGVRLGPLSLSSGYGRRRRRRSSGRRSSGRRSSGGGGRKAAAPRQLTISQLHDQAIFDFRAALDKGSDAWVIKTFGPYSPVPVTDANRTQFVTMIRSRPGDFFDDLVKGVQRKLGRTRAAAVALAEATAQWKNEASSRTWRKQSHTSGASADGPVHRWPVWRATRWLVVWTWRVVWWTLWAIYWWPLRTMWRAVGSWRVRRVNQAAMKASMLAAPFPAPSADQRVG